VLIIFVTLLKPEFAQQIFGKYSNTQLHENPCGYQSCSMQMDGLTDRQTRQS